MCSLSESKHITTLHLLRMPHKIPDASAPRAAPVVMVFSCARKVTCQLQLLLHASGCYCGCLCCTNQRPAAGLSGFGGSTHSPPWPPHSGTLLNSSRTTAGHLTPTCTAFKAPAVCRCSPACHQQISANEKIMLLIFAYPPMLCTDQRPTPNSA